MAVLKECLLRSGQDINIFKKLDKMNTYGHSVQSEYLPKQQILLSDYVA